MLKVYARIFSHSCGYLLTQYSVAPILLDFGSDLASQCPETNYNSALPSYDAPWEIVSVIYCVDTVCSANASIQPPFRREPSLPPVISNYSLKPLPVRAPTPPAVVPRHVLSPESIVPAAHCGTNGGG